MRMNCRCVILSLSRSVIGKPAWNPTKGQSDRYLLRIEWRLRRRAFGLSRIHLAARHNRAVQRAATFVCQRVLRVTRPNKEGRRRARTESTAATLPQEVQTVGTGGGSADPPSDVGRGDAPPGRKSDMAGVDERERDEPGDEGTSGISVLSTRLDFFFGFGAVEIWSVLDHNYPYAEKMRANSPVAFSEM